MKKILSILAITAVSTLSAFTGPSIDTSSPGTYKITYSVTDSFGQKTQVERIVVVKKNEKPTISLNGATSVTLNVGDVFSDPGATASDHEDGDISANIVKTGSVDTSKAGSYTIKYEITDSFGQKASVTRTVTVKTNNKPVLNLNGQPSVTMYVGQTFTDPGATATDTEDGDLSGAIVISGSVDTSNAGTYTRTYKVTDSDGNVITKTRTIIVKVNQKPVLILKGDQTVTIFVSQTFSDPGITATDAEDGDLSGSVTVSVQKIQ